MAGSFVWCLFNRWSGKHNCLLLTVDTNLSPSLFHRTCKKLSGFQLCCETWPKQTIELKYFWGTKGRQRTSERKKQPENRDFSEECMLKNMPGCTEVNMVPMEAQIHWTKPKYGHLWLIKSVAFLVGLNSGAVLKSLFYSARFIFYPYHLLQSLTFNYEHKLSLSLRLLHLSGVPLKRAWVSAKQFAELQHVQPSLEQQSRQIRITGDVNTNRKTVLSKRLCWHLDENSKSLVFTIL